MGVLLFVKFGGMIILVVVMGEGVGSFEFESVFDDYVDVEFFMLVILGGEYWKMD